uniref:RING-type domain-containing protein n=1 Tax=Heterosigma akashiwo TaxID=2829 RepID=A0A7S3XSC7_HETAK
MEGPNDSSVSERESSMATKRQDQITRKAPSIVFSTTTRQINENGEKTTRVVPTTTLLPTSGIQEVSVMELKLQPEVQDDCDICLETLSSLELEYSFCGSDCPLKACKECIAKHFKDTISSGYDGILRKMTCPACVKRSVPVSLWGPVCSSNQTTLYSRRAAILLTLQCSGCHERKTILPDEDENQVLPTDGMPKAVKEELLMEFERFNDGKINDQELYERISTYFFSFENLPNPWLVMQPILQKIRDEGFRAELYLRYLRHYPKVSTICCEAEQCFRCRTEDWHDGMTCEEMRKELEAEQLSDDVLNCPECDIQLVSPPSYLLS